MKCFITENQQKEIVMLSKDHWDALVAFGADVHSDGLIQGAIIGASGAFLGIAVSKAVRFIRYKKSKITA